MSLFLILLLSGSLFFLMAGEKQDLWIKAAAEKNLEKRLEYFDDYKAKFGEKKDENAKFLYYNLAQTTMQLKQFEKTIEYGEKTLTFEDLGDNYKLAVAIWLSNAYNLARKDYDKAYSYASMVIDTGKSLKGMSEGNERIAKLSAGIDKRYIAPAMRIQLRILLAKGIADTQARMDIIEKAIEAHSLDNSNAFPRRTVLKQSVELAKSNKTIEAINAIEKVVDPENLNLSEARLMASLYYRKYSKSKDTVDKDKAIGFYEVAYNKKKDSSMAVKIGQLLSKKNKEKAIQYFADAYILSKLDKESSAYKYLQQLWFKDKAKDQTPEEQEAGFNQIIEAAKSRLGHKEEKVEETEETTTGN